jgi:hypothetical protein
VQPLPTVDARIPAEIEAKRSGWLRWDINIREAAVLGLVGAAASALRSICGPKRAENFVAIGRAEAATRELIRAVPQAPHGPQTSRPSRLVRDWRGQLEKRAEALTQVRLIRRHRQLMTPPPPQH